MDTGVVIAIAAVMFIAIVAVIICIIAAVSSATGIKQTNDEDSQA